MRHTQLREPGIGVPPQLDLSDQVAPPLIRRRRRSPGPLLPFVFGLLLGAIVAALLLRQAGIGQERDQGQVAAASVAPLPSPPPLPPDPATVEPPDVPPPPRPRIDPNSNPPEVPEGPKVDPMEHLGLYELPGEPGRFSFRGLSFEYPRSWEMVRSGGYHGLVGNNLWVVPIGVDEVDHVLIMANYFPWQYSSKQMKSVTQQFIDYLAEVQPIRVLRPPTPVETGGVTVHWTDVAGFDPSTSTEIIARHYLFAWNDVEYLFSCQEAIGSDAGIIRGCDQIFSTLQLGSSG